MLRSFFSWTSLLLLLGLSACGGFKELDTRGCPQPIRVSQAGSYTLFKEGKGRDIIDVAFSGQIGNISLSCKYKDDLVRSTLRFEILATKGPAAKGDAVRMPFFVAVVDAKNNILEKQVFETNIAFPEGRRRAGVFEEIEQTVQLGPRQRSDSFKVMFGFQLSRDQVTTLRKSAK